MGDQPITTREKGPIYCESRESLSPLVGNLQELWDILFSFLRAQEADALMDERVRLLPASDPKTLKTGADIAMTELNVV